MQDIELFKQRELSDQINSILRNIECTRMVLEHVLGHDWTNLR